MCFICTGIEYRCVSCVQEMSTGVFPVSDEAADSGLPRSDDGSHLPRPADPPGEQVCGRGHRW